MTIPNINQQLFTTPPSSPQMRRAGSPMGTPTKRAGSPMGTPTKRAGSPMGTPTKRAGSPMGTPPSSPSKGRSPPKKKIGYAGTGAFTPEVRQADGSEIVIKDLYVVGEKASALLKRKFELDNKDRTILKKGWDEIKAAHLNTEVPNVVRTYKIVDGHGETEIYKCEIHMERVNTLFQVLPTLTLEQRVELARKLWKTLAETNAFLAQFGLGQLNDPALNWGLDEDGNVKFFDLLFSKKMTIASGFKFSYDGQVALSQEDEKKIVQLRAFVLMLLVVENFKETSCRLDFENLVRKLYIENKVGDMSIADLESFLNLYL